VTGSKVLDGGEAWYVATGMDDAGVEWVVRRVLDRHGLVGPYADAGDVELAVRSKDGVRFAFVLSHATEPVEVVAHASGVDLLTGRTVRRGETLVLNPTDVLLLRESSSEVPA
jgi:beta-galactosidase